MVQLPEPEPAAPVVPALPPLVPATPVVPAAPVVPPRPPRPPPPVVPAAALVPAAPVPVPAVPALPLGCGSSGDARQPSIRPRQPETTAEVEIGRMKLSSLGQRATRQGSDRRCASGVFRGCQCAGSVHREFIEEGVGETTATLRKGADTPLIVSSPLNSQWATPPYIFTELSRGLHRTVSEQ